jgi:hypothetical protein
VTDLRECRENVQKCIDWANEALDVDAQNSYFEMAKAWLNLAKLIEYAQAREHVEQPRPALKRVAGDL